MCVVCVVCVVCVCGVCVCVCVCVCVWTNPRAAPAAPAPGLVCWMHCMVRGCEKNMASYIVSPSPCTVSPSSSSSSAPSVIRHYYEHHTAGLPFLIVLFFVRSTKSSKAVRPVRSFACVINGSCDGENGYRIKSSRQIEHKIRP
jgi:hypothetical protein